MNLKKFIRKILREESKKMSPFFLRRVDIDTARNLLKINAEQVFYETESYRQFKYELTLRAVESIMWNEYELGWEHLPEQEEIEFVTQLSDMFDKTIKQLYKIYHSKQ
jgi:5-formyltetrahydrofolate cyclo-ligase